MGRKKKPGKLNSHYTQIQYQYWMEQGLPEVDAKQRVSEIQRERCVKGRRKKFEEDPLYFRKNTHRCVEYWLERGFDEETAKKKVSELQHTFSLERCVEKYGEHGIEKWKERQEKWQSTLNSKTDEEKENIKSKKRVFIRLIDLGKIDQLKEYLDSRKIPVIFNIDEFSVYIKSFVSKECHRRFWSIDTLIRYLPGYAFYICGLNEKQQKQEFIKSLNVLESVDVFRCRRGRYGQLLYQKYDTITGKLLRSSGEIYFAELLQQYGIKDYEVDGIYPHSNLRFDFYLRTYQKYVEICGSDDFEYVQKMSYKQQSFGSILLWKKKDYEPFLKSLLNENNNREVA